MTPGQVYKVFDCGCVYPLQAHTPHVDFGTRTKTGQRQRLIACPVCRERISYFFKICPQCGKERRTKRGGGVPRNGICPDCAYQNRLAQARDRPKGETKKEKGARYKAESDRAQEMKKASADCYDCVSRDACLVKHQMDDVFPCLDCGRYEAGAYDIGISTYRDYDPYELAEAFEMEAI